MELDRNLHPSGTAAQAVPELTSRVVNEACWKFIDAMPHPLTPQVWNNLKPAVYAAVVHVLTAQPSEQAQPMDISSGHKAQQPASAPAAGPNRIGWAFSATQARALAAELIHGAECMGGADDDDEEAELLLEVREPGSVTDDDGTTNTGYVLAISIDAYPEEGVYPIDPAELAASAPADVPKGEPSDEQWLDDLREMVIWYGATIDTDTDGSSTRRLQKIVDHAKSRPAPLDAAAIRNAALSEAIQVILVGDAASVEEQGYMWDADDCADAIRDLKTDQQEKGE